MTGKHNDTWREYPHDPRYLVRIDGEIRGPSGRLLRARTAKHGYKQLDLGRRNTQLAHRVVLETWVGHERTYRAERKSK